MNDYQVNFLREESFCHISPQVNQSYIDITPVFQVRQEQRGARSVKFSYYVKTPDGNTTLYPEEISVPAKRQSYCHKGKTIRVKIPEKQKYYYCWFVLKILTDKEFCHLPSNRMTTLLQRNKKEIFS